MKIEDAAFVIVESFLPVDSTSYRALATIAQRYDIDIDEINLSEMRLVDLINLPQTSNIVAELSRRKGVVLPYE